MWAIEHALLTRLKSAASLRSLSRLTKSALGAQPLELVESLVARGLVKRIPTGLYLCAKVPFLFVGATESFRNDAFSHSIGGLLCEDLAALFGDDTLDRVGWSYFVCTVAGNQVVDRDKNEIMIECSAAIEMSSAQLLKGDCRGAIAMLQRHAELSMISEFEPGCNSTFRTHIDEDTLREIFSSRPKLLGVMRDEAWFKYQLATAMNYLWGDKAIGRTPIEHINLKFSAEICCQMILDLATLNRDVKYFRDNRMLSVAALQIEGAQDACDACKELTGRIYPLDCVPELPNPKCTCRLGCRCKANLVL